jgi:hypothetical protein
MHALSTGFGMPMQGEEGSNEPAHTRTNFLPGASTTQALHYLLLVRLKHVTIRALSCLARGDSIIPLRWARLEDKATSPISHTIRTITSGASRSPSLDHRCFPAPSRAVLLNYSCIDIMRRDNKGLHKASRVQRVEGHPICWKKGVTK